MISGLGARGAKECLHCRFRVFNWPNPIELHAGHRTLYLIREDSTLLGYFDMHGILLVFLLYHIWSPRVHDYHVRYSTEDKRSFIHIFCM